MHGENSGPPEMPEFFEGVTYGESGVEYEANCTHASHTILTALLPLMALNYIGESVLKARQTLDSNAVSSYAAPWVIDFPLLLIPICHPKVLNDSLGPISLDKLAEIVLLQFHNDEAKTLEIVSSR